MESSQRQERAAAGCYHVKQNQTDSDRCQMFSLTCELQLSICVCSSVYVCVCVAVCGVEKELRGREVILGEVRE